ncbi:MAG: SH3 domain-containing protein, partial [Bryobacter sp.]|nr:SH3 domain-containing protein [Bryobacter sp.]
MLALLLAALAAQEITLLVPESVMAGEEVVLRSAPGVELRVDGPTRMLGEVTAASLNVRKGPGTTFDVRGILYRGERVLIASITPDDWCEVLLPNGGRGFVSCPFLNRSDFGQPLGVTKEDGSLTTSALAVVPAELELAAYFENQPVAHARLTVKPFIYDRSETIAPGIEYRERRWVTEGDGPFTLQALEVDPRHPAVNLLPVRAFDRTVGRERPTSMARRYGATAAVNAGYFVTTGPYMGASSGVYQFDRQVQSGGSGRTALLFCAEQEFIEQVAFDVVNFRGRVTAPSGASAAITGLNRARGAQDLLVYQPSLGPRTLTDHSGVEAVLDAAGRVTQLRSEEGNSEIPTGGVVLSGSGAGANWLRANAQQGTLLELSLALERS